MQSRLYGMRQHLQDLHFYNKVASELKQISRLLLSFQPQIIAQSQSLRIKNIK